MKKNFNTCLFRFILGITGLFLGSCSLFFFFHILKDYGMLERFCSHYIFIGYICFCIFLPISVSLSREICLYLPLFSYFLSKQNKIIAFLIFLFLSFFFIQNYEYWLKIIVDFLKKN